MKVAISEWKHILAWDCMVTVTVGGAKVGDYLSTINTDKPNKNQTDLSNPGLVASYDIRPGNGSGLFYTAPGDRTG